MTDFPRALAADSDEGKELRQWFQSLADQDRGGRALLRRVHSLGEVHFIPSFHRLRVAVAPSRRWRDEPFAAIAALSAHIREDVGTDAAEPGEPTLGRRMARPKDDQGERPCVSLLRFRRLLQCETIAGMYRPMLRVLKLLNGRVDLLELARLVYWWEGDHARRNLARDYYETVSRRTSTRKDLS